MAQNIRRVENLDLQVSELSVAYGSAIALSDVSLNIRKGSVTCVIGPNGAGKTTLLNTIAGAIKPRRGKILASGTDISPKSTAQRVKLGIVLCPERRRLFPGLSVEENIILGAYLRRDKSTIKEDLDYVYSLFPVLVERKKQQAGTLSGGEQQMVAIGRSIMSRPNLLMLDEPSLGLSPLMRERIFEAIKDLNNSKGTTILLVEQDASDALSVSEYSYVLESGHIVMHGDSRDISVNPEVRKAYLGL